MQGKETDKCGASRRGVWRLKCDGARRETRGPRGAPRVQAVATSTETSCTINSEDSVHARENLILTALSLSTINRSYRNGFQ